MRNISDAQQSTLIGVVAKIPVPEARKVFIAKVERRMPVVGGVTDEAFADIVNAALASFTPGAYVADERGAWRAWDYIDPSRTLKEASEAYLRVLRDDGSDRARRWPPYPPRPVQPAEPVESYTQWAARMSPEERERAGDEYARGFFATEEDYLANRAQVDRHRVELEMIDTTPFPLPAPPSTQTILGEVVHEPDPEHSDEDLRRIKAERPDEDDDEMSPMAKASELFKRRGKRPGWRDRPSRGRPPVFFK